MQDNKVKLSNMKTTNKTYEQSEQLLARALKTIPLGTQTFSKSKTQYPLGVSPFYITHANGSHVWDADGNEYVDFINSLASITLGYNDAEVMSAVRNQLEDGTIFSLPHPLEVEVAEKLCEMVPCAEMVRFGKNGSDATSGAIRLARAYTGRDHVAICGYHGWHDWYIGTTARHRGVPEVVRGLSHTFTYNDIASLSAVFDAHHGQIAAVILEPMNVVEPANGFLEEVKKLTHDNGALLVFDETITGFRFANGGAQQLFGVIPDLATFGKGLANGYPISAIAGREDVMKLLEEIFFSFTFGGETLSLAAALATMTKLQNAPVLQKIHDTGSRLKSDVEKLIQRHGLTETLSISGHPSWSFLTFKDTAGYSLWQLKTLFFQEIFANGILSLGTHNISYAHNEEDTSKILTVYDHVFALMQECITKQTLESKLKCKPLEPLFKIR